MPSVRMGAGVRAGGECCPGSPSSDAAGGAHGLVERRVLVLLEHGIHARPAATLAAVAKKLAADINIVFGDRKANAKSPVALMSLGVRKGDHIVIQASGVDAESAVATLSKQLPAERIPTRTRRRWR